MSLSFSFDSLLVRLSSRLALLSASLDVVAEVEPSVNPLSDWSDIGDDKSY